MRNSPSEKSGILFTVWILEYLPSPKVDQTPFLQWQHFPLLQRQRRREVCCPSFSTYANIMASVYWAILLGAPQFLAFALLKFGVADMLTVYYSLWFVSLAEGWENEVLTISINVMSGSLPRTEIREKKFSIKICYVPQTSLLASVYLYDSNVPVFN